MFEERILNLARELETEEDAFAFAEGKDELLGLLDEYMIEYESLKMHYEPQVETVLYRDSIFDLKVAERIIAGKEFISKMAGEKNLSMVKKGLIKLNELEMVWKNRRWGKRGIYYTKIIER